MRRQLHITFVSPKRYSFYPPDYLGRGLGGSESALFLLSRALAHRGHDIEVYNCCYKPGVYGGVAWKPLWEFDPKRRRDAVISLRLLETFQQSVNAPIRAVWIHDESLRGATQLDREKKVNLWISVSKTQRRFLEKQERISPSHWFVTRNTLDEEIYNDALRQTHRRKGQVIYCSAPDRGLSYLLEYWPEIRKRVPSAHLLISGSFALWGNADEENERFFHGLYKTCHRLHGIELIKRVSKKDVALAQAESQLMTYPTDFNEMYCISAIECQSMGTPIVSTALAAMNERVRNGIDGFLIKGNPKDNRYKRQFIEKTALLLTDPEKWEAVSRAAILLTKDLTSANLAADWEKKLFSLLR